MRFNVARGGSADLDDLEHLARRVAALPAASIDHLGMYEDGLHNLLRLVEQGVRVKATGFGRVELDPAKTIKAIMNVDPTPSWSAPICPPHVPAIRSWMTTLCTSRRR